MAIIVAGGGTVMPFPLGLYCYRPMLPFLNRPLLEHQLLGLRSCGVRDVGIALSSESRDSVEKYFGSGEEFGLRLSYAVDPQPRGPAGCLRLFEQFVDSKPFLVVGAMTYFGTCDLDDLVSSHETSGAVMTVGVSSEGRAAAGLNVEVLVTAPDGAIREVRVQRPAGDQQPGQRFAEVYVCSPTVLRSIPAVGFFDIKEQLIPQLVRSGQRVVSHALRGTHACLSSVAAYARIQFDALQSDGPWRSGCMPCADGAWVARGSQISRSARIKGSVLIGPGCSIGSATIIGPAIVGRNCRIGDGAHVQESVLWDHVDVQRGSRVDSSILGSRCRIRLGACVHKRILLMNGRATADSYAFPLSHAAGLAEIALPMRNGGMGLRRATYRCLKRVTDVVLSAGGLILVSPVLMLLAVLIKLDSPGPVLFVQWRCGHKGKTFRMFKFRTMEVGAEDQQARLLSLNSVDGPMFKIFEDPRVTRFGAFLRRGSLDELPQLYNVLKGEMSLVGPRPLVMEEMRCNPSWRDLRLTVKPGITGLWQINGRSATAFSDWIRHDLTYVKNQSFAMDFRILLRTVAFVLTRIGAW